MSWIQRSRSNRVVLITMLLLFFVVLSVQAQAIVLTEPFDDPALPGWEHTPNAAVVEGVLRIEGGGFAFHGGDFSNVEISLQARREGDGQAIVFFQNSGGQSYIVVIGNQFLLMQRESGGEVVELAAAREMPTLSEDWFHLLIHAMDGGILILVNDELVVEAFDPEPLPAGGIGFEVAGGATAEFDDLAVFGQGAPEGEPQEPVPQPSDSVPEYEGELSWVRTGGPLGGLGYDVRMRPDDPDKMYVTDAFAGVFISEDGGLHWFPSNQGINSQGGMSGDAIPIFSLTIDPNDYDTIWVGTQNTRGIFMSEDAGQSWQRRDNGVVENEGITFRGFTIDPTDSNTVYAAAEVSSWAWATEEQEGREFDLVKGVVYKTTDKGQNWTAVWRGNNLARYIWVDPTNTDVLYVSTGIFDREAANSDPEGRVPGGEGVIKSTDGGQTWQNINNGLDNLYVGTLFMHPEDPDILLAGAGNNQYYEGSGVYITTDGGNSWQQTLINGGSTSVEFSSNDPQIAYAADPGAVFRSEDGGFTWRQMDSEAQGWGPPGILAGFPIDLQVDPRDTDRVFANNYGGGNFLSTDGGSTWVVASAGYTGAQVRAIAVDPNDPAAVYAAARSGLFASIDGGSTWQGLNFPPAKVLEWNAVAVDPTTTGTILAANNWMGTILRSTNGGQSWNEALPYIREGLAWRSFVYCPSDPQIVYAGSAAYSTGGIFNDRLDSVGIYVSTDGGASWKEANDSSTQNAQVAGLAVHPTDPQVVYAAATNKGLFKTNDGGQTWNSLNQGLPGNFSALAVAVSPVQPDLVIAGLDGQGVYRSTDGGASWTQSSAGLNPEAGVASIVFDPNNAQVVYLGDRGGGVYRSSDEGKTWESINNGLLTRSVNALSMSSDGMHLYAATEGGGVFRLDINGTAPVSSGSALLPEVSDQAEPDGDAPSQPDKSESDIDAAGAAAEDVGDSSSIGAPNVFLIAGVALVGLLTVGGIVVVILRKTR